MVASTAAREAEQALQQAQAELAHVTRLTTLGQLTASIAHTASPAPDPNSARPISSTA